MVRGRYTKSHSLTCQASHTTPPSLKMGARHDVLTMTVFTLTRSEVARNDEPSMSHKYLHDDRKSAIVAYNVRACTSNAVLYMCVCVNMCVSVCALHFPSTHLHRVHDATIVCECAVDLHRYARGRRWAHLYVLACVVVRALFRCFHDISLRRTHQ